MLSTSLFLTASRILTVIISLPSYIQIFSNPSQHSSFVLIRPPSPPSFAKAYLDHETLDLVLQRADLAHEIGSLVGGDGAANDGSADTAGTAKSHLGWDVDL